MSLGNPMWMSSIDWEKKSVMNHNMWVSVSKCECVCLVLSNDYGNYCAKWKEKPNIPK